MGRVEQALPVKQLCSRQGFSEANYYLWRSKYGGLSVSDAKRLKKRLAGSPADEPANRIPFRHVRRTYG